MIMDDTLKRIYDAMQVGPNELILSHNGSLEIKTENGENYHIEDAALIERILELSIDTPITMITDFGEIQKNQPTSLEGVRPIRNNSNFYMSSLERLEMPYSVIHSDIIHPSSPSIMGDWSIGEDGIKQTPEIGDDLYGRQAPLQLDIPEKICIIGLGGIGVWVALNMALVGVEKMFLIDYDKIEEHNLNRTPFKETDIGNTKIAAITELILERRKDAELRTFNKKVEELSEFEYNELENCMVIDCRDKIDPLPKEIQKHQIIKLGYDGFSVTAIFNPEYEGIWDFEPDRGYNTVPSFLVPCQYLAMMIVTLITNPEFKLEEKENKVLTFDLKEQIQGMI